MAICEGLAGSEPIVRVVVGEASACSTGIALHTAFTGKPRSHRFRGWLNIRVVAHITVGAGLAREEASAFSTGIA